MKTAITHKIKSRIRTFLWSLFPPTAELAYVIALEESYNAVVFTSKHDFIYPFNPTTRRKVPNGKLLICSNTADYSKIIESDLNALRRLIKKAPNKSFRKTELRLLSLIKKLSVLATKYPDMLYHDAESLDEAIQKILFYNALFWQAGHYHVGLGRLDKVLYKYYRTDIERGRITRQDAYNMLYRMLLVLDDDMSAKSGMIEGDTGQYILLGGIDNNGSTVENELTHIFLEIFQDYGRPDPKLILRVNNHTANQIWGEAIDCILNGHGSPLLMNESPIMVNMIKFGYEEKDVYNVGTSACWEPLIIGKSFDQNNSLPSIIVIQSLNKVFERDEPPEDFKSFLSAYKDTLNHQLCNEVHDIEFDVSPLYSLFFDDCIRKGADYTRGGAKYAYHGLEIVSFPNTINALLNIKHLVYEKHILTWQQCKEAIQSNFEGHEDILQLLKSGDDKYGNSSAEVISLTNDLMTFIGDMVKNLSINGQPVKVGFSSPNYITQSANIGATLDGRKNGEPFAVHISPISAYIDIAEIIDFASQLNYADNRINGNVVDFIIPTSYAKNKEKLIAILQNAVRQGVFELQLNTLDSKTLIAARKNPEQYKHLIVRVWGFSAYFNDLPEEYKDNLIKRALLYETA